ncbi:MAG: hypothetical protein RIC55_05495 [Pirellulaceae bacterium]
MKLESVRALKAELLSVPKAIVEAVASSTFLTAFSARHGAANRIMDDIALGVTAPDKKQFRLAVRLQRQGPLISMMTEQIRARAKGEIDVQYVGSIVKYAGPGETTAAFYRQKRRPLRIGSSISDVQTGFNSAGTLGCFVVRRQSPHYLGMLTNNHVIANENGNSAGDPVVQQGTLDGGKPSTGLVGELGPFIALKSSANFVDAAVGYLYEGVDFDPRRIGDRGALAGQVSVFELPPKATVYKVGRTTGQTKGRITAFDVDNVRVQYDAGVMRFDNQIEIEGAGNAAFSDSGDSGSLIVDAKRRAVALLFAGGDVGGSNGKGLTFANPIQTVLDALKVDLEQ